MFNGILSCILCVLWLSLADPKQGRFMLRTGAMIADSSRIKGVQFSHSIKACFTDAEALPLFIRSLISIYVKLKIQHIIRHTYISPLRYGTTQKNLQNQCENQYMSWGLPSNSTSVLQVFGIQCPQASHLATHSSPNPIHGQLQVLLSTAKVWNNRTFILC